MHFGKKENFCDCCGSNNTKIYRRNLIALVAMGRLKMSETAVTTLIITSSWITFDNDYYWHGLHFYCDFKWLNQGLFFAQFLGGNLRHIASKTLSLIQILEFFGKFLEFLSFLVFEKFTGFFKKNSWNFPESQGFELNSEFWRQCASGCLPKIGQKKTLI